MSAFVIVTGADSIEDGGMKEVSLEGRRVLLARAGERYYAADIRCTHLGGNLADGKLSGTIVTCPKHGSQFDLRDGSVVRWLQTQGLVAKMGRVLKPPKPLSVYNVIVEHGSVKIEI